ncbi:MAG TPA: alpha-glucosidase C-terminal domain-containing protein, partial [Candidatus Acidoferrales bacterium]|nr:alpha-glucosidase C-terminal domain-containing protein [Candidatus Acidoferrales bacterium]
RSEPALRDGKYLPLDRGNPDVLSFLRKTPGNGDSILVVLNMSDEPRTVNLALDAHGVKESSARPLISAPKIARESAVLAHFTVPAFGVFIGSVH